MIEELMACKRCGCNPEEFFTVIHTKDTIIDTKFSVVCPTCGNKIENKATQERAVMLWNKIYGSVQIKEYEKLREECTGDNWN